MQTKIQKPLGITLFALVILAMSWISFVPNPGGDHFEIYLNKKLVLQQYVGQNTSVKSLALDQRNINDQVEVFYSHCGKLGSNRTMTIKEGKTVLKQWRFANGADKKFMGV